MLPRLFAQSFIDGLYWTLQHEVVFYLAIAYFVVSRHFIRRLRLFTWLWLMASPFETFLPDTRTVNLLTLHYAPYFGIGIAIYLMGRERPARSDYVLAIFAAGEAIVYGKIHFGSDLGWTRPEAWIPSAIFMASACAVYVSPYMVLGRRTEKLAFVLGGLSYPIYLLHLGAGGIIIRWLVPSEGAWALASTSCIVLAASYVVWLLELPIRKWLTVNATLERARRTYPSR